MAVMYFIKLYLIFPQGFLMMKWKTRDSFFCFQIGVMGCCRTCNGCTCFGLEPVRVEASMMDYRSVSVCWQESSGNIST